MEQDTYRKRQIHHVRLETEQGHFVCSGRMPSFPEVPKAIVLGTRIFILDAYPARIAMSSASMPHIYREVFAVPLVEVDP